MIDSAYHVQNQRLFTRIVVLYIQREEQNICTNR